MLELKPVAGHSKTNSRLERPTLQPLLFLVKLEFQVVIVHVQVIAIIRAGVPVSCSVHLALGNWSGGRSGGEERRGRRLPENNPISAELT